MASKITTAPYEGDASWTIIGTNDSDLALALDAALGHEMIFDTELDETEVTFKGCRFVGIVATEWWNSNKQDWLDRPDVSDVESMPRITVAEANAEIRELNEQRARERSE